MNRAIAIFGAIAIVSGIAAAILWQQLGNEQSVKAESAKTTQAPLLEETVQQLPAVQITAPASGKRRAEAKN